MVTNDSKEKCMRIIDKPGPRALFSDLKGKSIYGTRSKKGRKVLIDLIEKDHLIQSPVKVIKFGRGAEMELLRTLTIHGGTGGLGGRTHHIDLGLYRIFTTLNIDYTKEKIGEKYYCVLGIGNAFVLNGKGKVEGLVNFNSIQSRCDRNNKLVEKGNYSRIHSVCNLPLSTPFCKFESDLIEGHWLVNTPARTLSETDIDMNLKDLQITNMGEGPLELLVYGIGDQRYK